MSNSTDGREPRRQPHEPPVELTATQARQGSFGRPVALVLGGALLLALIGWGAVEYWAEAQDDAAEATRSEPAVHNSQPKTQPNAQPSNGSTAETAPSSEQKAGKAPTEHDPTYQTGTGGQSPVTTPNGTQR